MVDCHLSFGISRKTAGIITFLVSIVFHEILITAILSKFTPYLAIFSMVQIPLLSLMRSPMFQGAWLGNIVFWSSLLLGLSLNTCLYFKEYCSQAGNCHISWRLLALMNGLCLLIRRGSWIKCDKICLNLCQTGLTSASMSGLNATCQWQGTSDAGSSGMLGWRSWYIYDKRAIC